jgi:adenine phosphoribosyltransferase
MTPREHAESLIVEIPDYPTPGVVFKDLTPVFADARGLEYVTEVCRSHFADMNLTAIAGIEARGFIFGGALAGHMDLGFVPIRKAGKLPRQTYRVDYSLEYGKDSVEIHTDALSPADRVLLVDDVLATGGTATAAAELVEHCGATTVGLAVLLNLNFLGGEDRFRARFPETEVFTVFA